MPSINDVFGGETLKATDLNGKSVNLTIAGQEVREFEEEKNGQKINKKKIVLSFQGTKKKLVVNITNATRIAALYGDDYTLWSGHVIQLRSEKVQFGNKFTDGIRVYPPNDKIETKQQPALKDEMADEIPF